MVLRPLALAAMSGLEGCLLYANPAFVPVRREMPPDTGQCSPLVSMERGSRPHIVRRAGPLVTMSRGQLTVSRMSS